MMGQLSLFPLDDHAREIFERSKSIEEGGQCTIRLEDFRFLYMYARGIFVEPEVSLADVLQRCRAMVIDARVPCRVIDEVLMSDAVSQMEIGMNQRDEVESKVTELLEILGVDLGDPNYKDTPRRFTEYLKAHFDSNDEKTTQLEEMKRAIFPSRYDGIITVGPTRAYGMCPHHLLPVIYTITVGYIPKSKVIGLSKLSRIPKLVALEPQLQEDVTVKIAEVLSDLLETFDIAVLVEGQHQCMQVRGVEEDGASTTTSVMWGLFTDDEGGCKSEFFEVVKRQRRE